AEGLRTSVVNCGRRLASSALSGRAGKAPALPLVDPRRPLPPLDAEVGSDALVIQSAVNPISRGNSLDSRLSVQRPPTSDASGVCIDDRRGTPTTTIAMTIAMKTGRAICAPWTYGTTA